MAPRLTLGGAVAILLAAASLACGPTNTPPDSGDLPDAGPELDAGSPMDAGVDAGSSMDAGLDAGPDAGSPEDAGVDAGADPDAGPDAGPVDGGPPPTVFPPRDYTCAPGDAPPCMTTTPDDPAGRTVVVEREITPPAEHTFVLSYVILPVASSGAVVGFNLDALDSGSGSTAAGVPCGQAQPDYRSVTDPGHVGVDSRLQAMRTLVDSFTGGDVDAHLAAEVGAGNFLLGFRVSEVDSLVHDELVYVQLLMGDPGQAPMVDAVGRVLPGQTFDGVALGPPLAADLLDGRLAVSGLPDILIPIYLGADPLPLRSSVARFDLLETGLMNGALGSVTLVDDQVAAAAQIMPDFAPMVRRVIEDDYADLQPSAADPEICEALSVGLFFQAVPATFVLR